MSELDPATLAERVLRLSRSPPFDRMSLEDLTLVAAAGREQVFPSRTVLARAGERAGAHYVPLAGRLRLLSDLPELADVAEPPGAGALSVLGGAMLPGDLVAEPGSVLLVFDRDALVGALEEHGHLARSFLRLIALKLLDVRRLSHSEPAPSQPPPTVRLDLVSRMLTLREALGLGIDGMATIARLARVAKARQYPAGSLPGSGDQPSDVLILLEGSFELKVPGAPARTVRPGEVLGLAEAVAGVPLDGQVTASSESTALLLSHHELLEDIEDDDALCLELIRSFAAQLWAALVAARFDRRLWQSQPAGG
ncbi:MAG TPA: cyclic nucleotide-binding domain-containing protein [Myxococcaceae bacterium]|nr:cyclic nucleotide-binding domain-containing protein [Myxococcaceae bacterium]